MKQMGVAAGMLDRVYMHGVRLGSARDGAQLPSASTPGYNTDHVRQVLGHSIASTTSGVTDRYVGGLQSDIYSLRAQHATQARGRQPKFSTTDGKIESLATIKEKLNRGFAPITYHHRPLADQDVYTLAANAREAARQEARLRSSSLASGECDDEVLVSCDEGNDSSRGRGCFELCDL
jgi:hypothetical protein